MKKAGILSLLLMLFAITIIANNPLASVPPEEATTQTEVQEEPVTPEDQQTKALIPSPSLMLLIGSGLVGLIVYRKKFKDRK